MKVQLVTPYRVGHLQRYGVTVRGNVTSVYPPYVKPGSLDHWKETERYNETSSHTAL